MQQTASVPTKQSYFTIGIIPEGVILVPLARNYTVKRIEYDLSSKVYNTIASAIVREFPKSFMEKTEPHITNGGKKWDIWNYSFRLPQGTDRDSDYQKDMINSFKIAIAVYLNKRMQKLKIINRFYIRVASTEEESAFYSQVTDFTVRVFLSQA